MPSPLVTPSYQPSRPTPYSPVPTAVQHRAQVSDDYVAPVTLGVGLRAQTFLLVADTGSNPNSSSHLNPGPNLNPSPSPNPNPYQVADTGSSALAVVGDPKLGCLHYLDTSDRCDTDRHVECLYGSGGWRGVDCHRDVAVQAADSVPHRHRQAQCQAHRQASYSWAHRRLAGPIAG